MPRIPAALGRIPHAEPRVARRWASAVAILIALLMALPAHGASGPEQVIVDYGDDGRINQPHSLRDLRGALELFADSPQYGSFADAVSAEIDELLLGVAPEPEEPREPAGDRPTERDDDATAPVAAGGSGGSAPGAARLNERAPAAAAPPASASAAIAGDLPAPPIADPDADLPLPFVVLTGLAALLMLSGIGAAVHRRLSA